MDCSMPGFPVHQHILGWPKSSFGFLHIILQKHLNDLIGQPNICEWPNGAFLGKFGRFSFLSFGICFHSLVHPSLVYLIFRWLEPSNHLLFLPLPKKLPVEEDYIKFSCTKLKIIISCWLAFDEIILVEFQILGTDWKRLFMWSSWDSSKFNCSLLLYVY